MNKVIMFGNGLKYSNSNLALSAAKLVAISAADRARLL